MDRHLALPLLVYALTAYALVATKPECMFDRATGMPKAFGTDPGQTLLPFYLAALMVAVMSTHYIPHPTRPPPAD